MPYDPATLKDKKILIIGLGVSGSSAAAFLLQKGAVVYAYDDNPDRHKSADISALVEKGLMLISGNDFSPPDLVVLSPGVPATHPIAALAKESKCEIIGEIELACRFLSQRMLGITGTNGKTSVTLLTAHVLNCAGIPARALGNSGIALTSALLQPLDSAEVLVVELSSYQLENLHTRCLDGAALLNITPDHLDRYSSMDEYAAAKLRIASCLKNGGELYIEAGCASQYASPHAFTFGYDPSCAIYCDLENIYFHSELQFPLPDRLRKRKSHEIDNMMASYALCRMAGVSGRLFAASYATFVKPPHRIELIRIHKGISYINDSKGTNLDAVIKAVDSIDGKVILIAGGLDKGASYQPWLKVFAEKVRCICAIGQAGSKIKQELGNDIPVRLYPSLNDAVYAASHVAKWGETVLLSPGCSSFDMFKDYAHRGNEFRRLVEAL